MLDCIVLYVGPPTTQSAVTMANWLACTHVEIHNEGVHTEISLSMIHSATFQGSLDAIEVLHVTLTCFS